MTRGVARQHVAIFKRLKYQGPGYEIEMSNASDSQLRRTHDLDGNRKDRKPSGTFLSHERMRQMRSDNNFHLVDANRS